jgi:DNA end-binding protein Ku
MARAIWSGTISFGLVSVGVKLFTAVRQQEVHFHLVHAEDGGRIHQQRVCDVDGKEVPWEEVAKGYELSRGKQVVITPEELETIDPAATRTIAIEDFVDPAEIDPVYFETTYHVLPDKGAERAYTLLVEAMEKEGKAAVARMVMRTRQYLCLVRVSGRGLALTTLNYSDEVVDLESLKGLPSARTHAPPREVEMARQLVASLSSSWDPSRYKDEYRAEVLALIRKKGQGKDIPTGEAAAPAETTVDLMEALQASLGRGTGSKEKTASGGRRQARVRRSTTTRPKRKRKSA